MSVSIVHKQPVQGGREVTVPRPIRYHNLIWITYVHLVTCPVDPYVHPDAGHTNIRLSLTHTVCPCAVSYAPTQSVPVLSLMDGDMDRRYESCRALLDTFSNAVSRSKVLFSDKCAIYRSARDRNVVFWSKENPNFTRELEHNPFSRPLDWPWLTDISVTIAMAPT